MVRPGASVTAEDVATFCAETLVRYKVKRGDTLGRIAARHHTTVSALLEINKLRNPRRLRPGTTLRIRPGRPTAPRKKRRRSASRGD